MAGAQLTYAQVLEAARRLPPGQRKSLVEDLTAAPATRPSRGNMESSYEVIRLSTSGRAGQGTLLRERQT
jgi:hypothetical protein